jgi:hypothetical protein
MCPDISSVAELGLIGICRSHVSHWLSVAPSGYVSLLQFPLGIRRPTRAYYFPKIVWFIRSTILQVCDSVPRGFFG